MAKDATPLADGDEIALLPPVAGGSGARKIAIRAEPLIVDETVAAVAGPNRGGVVTFTGVVRRQGHHLPDVIRLEYEAYVEMAEQVLAEIAEEIEREWPGTRSRSTTALARWGRRDRGRDHRGVGAPRAGVRGLPGRHRSLERAGAHLEERDQRHRRSLARTRTLTHRATGAQPERTRADNGRMRTEARRSAALDAIIGDDPALRAALARAALVAPTARPCWSRARAGPGRSWSRGRCTSSARARAGPSSPSTAARCRASWPRASSSATSAAPSRARAARRTGWFEEASGGTLLLDEIGELPLDAAAEAAARAGDRAAAARGRRRARSRCACASSR